MAGVVAVCLMGDHAAFHADALAQTLAEDFLALHIDQLVLQAGRTAVDNQNFHGISSLNWQGRLPFPKC